MSKAKQHLSDEQWSSRSLGSRFQHNIFCWLVRCRAMGLARGLLAVVVFYYTLLPSVRMRCAPYVRRRFGELSSVGLFRHAFRLYLNFGQVLLERMITSVTGDLPLVEVSAMREALSQTLTRGKGCLVVSAHVGAWQLGLGALDGSKSPHCKGEEPVDVHVLQWRDPADVDRHYFERGHAKGSVGPAGKIPQLIDASQPLGALIEVTAALRKGGVVALMGDRLMEDRADDRLLGNRPHEPHATAHYEHAVEAPFLGGRILLPTLAFALASITGAPLLMIFTVRDGHSIRPALGGEIVVPRGLNHRDPSVFAPYAAQFSRGLEDFVQEHPYQFFNFYNLWLDDNGQSEHHHKP